MRNAALAAVVLLAGCSGGAATTPPVRGIETTGNLTTADLVSGSGCAFSVDGLVWYTLPAGPAAPFDYGSLRCTGSSAVSASGTPPLPSWATPNGPTQAIFIATSLQEAYSANGMQAIADLAHGNGLPVTWMVGNHEYLDIRSNIYGSYHATFGDDVQLEDQTQLYTEAQRVLPWFVPTVSVEGAGHERKISELLGRGDTGFWGITWNSDGTDGTADRGAPWGTYCADVSSYKIPTPDGSCSLVSFEWTARDLTRAYLSLGTAQYSAEAEYSTDPDDVLRRGGFSPTSGAAYVRALVDAYASAGETEPLVMMSQQESHDEASDATTDGVVLGALYGEAKRVGMHALTLSSALPLARAFSARPRAVAFPFIAGGKPTRYNGVSFSPGTIDYHDDVAGMSFIAGHTLPSRLFTYARDPVSVFNHPLVETDPGPSYPQLTRVAVGGGALVLHFASPAAMHFGVAIWSDPQRLGVAGPNVVAAGRAGFVAAFDLPSGESDQSIPCSACGTTTLPYAE
jgi:hypothetical protein